MGRVPSLGGGGGDFCGILARIFANFGENHGKLRTAWMDNMTTMPYPGFEPRAFGVAAGFPKHCSAWSEAFSRNMLHVTFSIKCLFILLISFC